MVDPINGVGGVPGVGRAQNQRTIQDSTVETREVSSPRDEVSISQEAIDLAQVERATQEVRSALENDTSASLGLRVGVLSDV